MPFYTLSKQFEAKLIKKAKKDRDLTGQIADALKKFQQSPVPPGLHFKPVPGSLNRFYIWIPRRHGWRIIFRKIEQEDSAVYEAIDFGDHDIRREGN